MRCPSLSNLFEYTGGDLSIVEKEMIDRHLSSGCQTCLENQSWLTDLRRLIDSDEDVSYSESEIQRMVSIFNDEKASPTMPLRQMLAKLLFDSMFPRQHVYVRSENLIGSADLGRQYIYQADGYDIDLKIRQSSGGKDEDIIGQLLPPQNRSGSLPQPSARLYRGGVEIDRAAIDPRGNFRFSGVAQGTYDLSIQLSEGEILIHGLIA